MSMNITEVRLCAVPLESDYKHTLAFQTYAAQQQYFIGKTVHTSTNFSYQRKDKVIRYPMDYDELVTRGVNYVMYKNSANTTKWYFAFITKMEYVSEGVTHIHIKTDVIQTWGGNFTLKPCFVEREHCEDDTVGLHTIPEGLETGEYIVNKKYSIHPDREGGTGLGSLAVILGVARSENGELEHGYFYNGIYSGIRYYCFSAQSDNQLSEFLSRYDSEGVGDSIHCMFLAPKILVDNAGTITWNEPISESWDTKVIRVNPTGSQRSDKTYTMQFSEDYLDNRYVPRNKKLMCYPYRYLSATNNCGATAIYRFEEFRDELAGTGERERPMIEPSFVLEMSLTPGCSGRLYPWKYKNVQMNYDEGLTMGKYPILNWASDAFTNWMTQNSVNLGLSIVTGAGQIIGGAAAIAAGGAAGAAAGGGSAIAGGISEIAGTVGAIYQASMTPPNVKGNTNAGDIITSMGANHFDILVWSIKNEYARIIDSFFDMYGYKCHRVKVPATFHREAYWYTKTIDCEIDGNIPGEDMQEIKEIYNRGITFWRDPERVADYTQSNNTVGGNAE